MALCDDITKLLPAYTASYYNRGSVSVDERDAGAKVKHVIWTGANFQCLDPSIPKEFTSIFQASKSHKIFHFDCDGITLFDSASGRKYMFLSELKSTFDNGDIYHARSQIISSFLKINMLLHLLPGYRIEDYTIKGFIFSRPFNKSYLRDLYRAQMLNPSHRYATDAEFVLDLCHKHQGSIKLTPTDIYEFKGLPLGERGIFREIEINHIPVPEGSDTITLDVNNYL